MSRNSSKNIARLTACAMLSALGVVMLILGSFVEVVDISMAVIASLLCIFAVIEYGGASPWLVFSVTGVLSLILPMPNRTPAVMYVFFFGYYPIIKEKLERLNKVLCWFLKEVIFNIALAAILLIVKFVLMPTVSEPLWMVATLIIMAELVFILYDIALTRLISFYIVKLRHRLRINKK